MTTLKLAAEKVVRNCGVPCTILCPTWPMEQLPRFVRGGRAKVIGEIPPPWHWFAAQDLARMISMALQTEADRGKRLFVHGPQGISVKGALERYCQAFHLDIESVAFLYIEQAKAIADSTGNTFIKVFAERLQYFKKVDEPGDPKEANELLGVMETSLDDWIKQRQSSM